MTEKINTKQILENAKRKSLYEFASYCSDRGMGAIQIKKELDKHPWVKSIKLIDNLSDSNGKYQIVEWWNIKATTPCQITCDL